jgi:hypothetical protein
MKHDLIRMSAHQVLTAIHRGENALINVEGPHGRHVDGTRTWKALASHTVDGLLSCTRLAPWLVGEQAYFSLSSVYRAPRRKYVSEVTGLVVYSRDELQFLNCVCVDIDLAHNGEQFDFDAQVQQVLDFTLTAGLPYPSMVSDSGRGIWLFWLLKDRLNPGPPTAHNNLQVSHSRLLSATVAAYGKFNPGADSSCTDSQRVARFPGSINSSSGTVARYFRTSDRVFTIPELATGFGVKPRKTAITVREELTAECTGKPDCKCGGQRYDDAGKPKKPVCLTMRAQASKKRWSLPLAGLRKLAEIRGSFKRGHRNKAVYLFAAIGRLCKLADLQGEVSRFAGRHCPGLTSSKVRKCIKAARKSWKHIRNEKIAEMLKVTAEEREHLSFWLKPATRSKQAEIDHRRAILATEIALSGPLSIRKAVFVLGQRGVTSSRSRIGADLKYLRGVGVAGRGAQAPPPGPRLFPGAQLRPLCPGSRQKHRIPKILLVCRDRMQVFYRYKQDFWESGAGFRWSVA